jgi:hypothetical protein
MSTIHPTPSDAGFLLCFKKASHATRETSAVVAFQGLLQPSDMVHVEILAIRHCTPHKFTLYPYSGNTLLAPGFYKQSIRKCLGPAYDILHVPMDTQKGVRFLDSLRKYPDNTMELGEAWLRDLIRDRRMHAEIVELAGRSVFAAQAAAQLCGLRDVPESPSQLYRLLLENGAVPTRFE